MIDLDGLSIFTLGGIVEACLSNMKMLDFYFFSSVLHEFAIDLYSQYD